jgi:hypothetical protein
MVNSARNLWNKITELLQGSRAQEEDDVLLDSMLALPVLETEHDT